MADGDYVVELPPKLIPLFAKEGIRYRCSHGGRGSGKTRTFAKMAAIKGLIAATAGITSVILCVREFMNSLDESSFAEVRTAIQSDAWLSENYEVGEKYIRTRAGLPGRVDFRFAGLSKNLDSIKSKANILFCWADEAENISEAAWVKLIPTVREHGSEIWVTWNPERENSATNKRFRNANDPDMICVEMNWRDNPWFPDVLNAERLRDKRDRPDEYEWIWEGAYRTHVEGAYYASELANAKAAGRICKLTPDPLLPLLTYHDIGGSGRNADAYTIWVCQFVDSEIRVFAYYEAQGQSLKYHVNWLRAWCEKRDFHRVAIKLPHDGVSEGQGVTGKRYQDHWEDASDGRFEFDVDVIPNQGKGAALQRIEAARRLFGRISIDERECKTGLDALRWYHEKIDEDRGVGLGPNHDWSSHGADAFGLMCVDYTPPKKYRKEIVIENQGYV